MKNFGRLLIAAASLLSLCSWALAPIVPISEDTPVRVNAGLRTGLQGSPTEQGKFGVNNFGGGLGFAHNVGNDFEYNVSLSTDWASHNGSRIWTAPGRPSSGMRMDIQAGFRYMPELAERFYAGLNLGLGWGTQFGTSAKTEINDKRSFGDMNFKGGFAINYGFTEMSSFYLGVSYSLHNVRWGVTDPKLKGHSNWQGLDIPLGLFFALDDDMAIFVEANTRFLAFQKFVRSIREEVTVGLSYAI